MTYTPACNPCAVNSRHDYRNNCDGCRVRRSKHQDERNEQDRNQRRVDSDRGAWFDAVNQVNVQGERASDCPPPAPAYEAPAPAPDVSSGGGGDFSGGGASGDY